MTHDIGELYEALNRHHLAPLWTAEAEIVRPKPVLRNGTVWNSFWRVESR